MPLRGSETEHWKAFEKGVFEDLPTKYGSIRIFRGDECVLVIPIQGNGEKHVAVAIRRAKVVAKVMGASFAQRMKGTISEEEAQMIRKGRKLLAIKTHRERTGASLMESKHLMDRAVVQLADSQPVDKEEWDVWE